MLIKLVTFMLAVPSERTVLIHFSPLSTSTGLPEMVRMFEKVPFWAFRAPEKLPVVPVTVAVLTEVVKLPVFPVTALDTARD